MFLYHGNMTFSDLGPSALLTRVRAARATADRAEVDILELALAWADAHPVLPEHPTSSNYQNPNVPFRQPSGEPYPARPSSSEEPEPVGIPEIRWDAPAAFAAANAMSTPGGTRLIRDALILRHRLPQVWARVQAGQVAAWRARRIADAVVFEPDDVAAHIDATVSTIAHKVGPITLSRLLDEAMLRLYPEQREQESLEELDKRYATLHENSITETGIGEMSLRADWKDLKDFDDALSRVAAALADTHPHDSLDVRRSLAIGVLADPEAAQALLARGTTAPGHPEDHPDRPPQRSGTTRL